MAVPASRFITDVGPKKAVAAASQPALPQPEPPSARDESKLFNKHDRNTPQDRINEAHAAGVAEGRAAAAQEWSRKLDEQRAFYEKQASLERVTWASREADRLTEQLAGAMHDIETRIADTAAELLRPFL